MLFYFVRHGQTSANAQGLLAGSGIDHPLNDEGHAQARRLAAALRRTVEHPIARVIASDMTRTRQTAKYLAEELGVGLEIYPDLREWHLGEWEGKTFQEFGHLLLGEGEPREGESRKTFYGRIEKAWRDVHSDEHPYLIVSHGAVWLALQDLLKIPRFKINNCDLIKVHAIGDEWSATVMELR